MNNNYGMNGGYPQADGNAASFGVMPTGNPTIDLLNQSNGIMPNSGNPVPVNTGNPTLDLLNQSQAQNMVDSSYSHISNNDMNSGSMDAFNSNPVPSTAYGQDNMGMMNYGVVPQQPLDGMGQMPGMAMPQAGQFGVESYAQPMQPSMDYTGQFVQQPLTSMEMAPVPEPMPVLEPTPEPPTNPYGFVSMMPEPTPEPAPSTDVAPVPQPVPSVNPEPIPPMPNMNPGVSQTMDYNQPYPQPNMGMPMTNAAQMPYGVDPMMQNMNNGMIPPQPMYPEQPVPQQMPYNNQMMPGYSQMPPAQNPNAIFPGIPDDFGNQ